MPQLNRVCVPTSLFGTQLKKLRSSRRKRQRQATKSPEAFRDMQKLAYTKEDSDRPSSSGIQQKPLVCLERTVQAMNRANEGNGPDGDALNCDGCQDLKAKLDGLENMLETMQKQNQKLLEDKKNLLEDRQRDKVEMGRLAEKMARLRTENATENPKKRCN